MNHVDASSESSDASSDDRVKLKKEISLFNGIGIVVGTIIGSGIFVSPKGVYQNVGSVGLSLLIWTLCGVFSMIGAVCYAELGTAIPKSGGDYAYILEAFGPLPAFLRLWVTVLVVQPATLAVLGLTFANYMVKPIFPDCDPPDAVLRILAALCLCLLTCLNCRSVKLALRVQDVFTGSKLLALVLIIIAGFYNLQQGKTKHFENSFQGEFSLSGISLSFYSGLFAYAGWNYINYVAEELKEPHKNLPRAIYIGISIVTFVYVLANVAYFTVVSPEEMVSSPAVAVTMATRMFGVVGCIMSIFVSMSTFGGLNGMLFTVSRLFFAGAQEGHLPIVFGMIHVNSLTPTPSLYLSCIFALLMLMTSDIFLLINYLSFNQWLWVGVTIVAQLWLRYKRPNMKRPIKVPLVFPIIFLVCCTFLTFVPVYAEPVQTGVGIVILLSGIPAYLVFVKWSAKLKTINKYSGMFTIELQKIFQVVVSSSSSDQVELKTRLLSEKDT